MTMFRSSTAALALCATTLAAPALAEGLSFSAGIALTSNYMSRGVTQSMNRPALQFYGEFESSGFYGGVWGSTVDFGPADPDNMEIDLYAGYRFSVGEVSVDVGYARYMYDSSGDCCGELYGLVEYETGQTTVFGGLYLDGAAGLALNDLHLGVRYAMNDRYGLSATVGRAPGVANYGVIALNIGLTDNLSASIAAHLSNVQRNVVATLSVDF